MKQTANFFPREYLCEVGSDSVRTLVTSLWYLCTLRGHYFSLSYKGLIYILQVST